MSIHSIVKSTLAIITLTAVASCQSNGTQTQASDSTLVSDSMPAVQPPLQDSSGLIHTPPINDSNAILPDSAIK
jgi:hypothetical protein